MSELKLFALRLMLAITIWTVLLLAARLAGVL